MQKKILDETFKEIATDKIFSFSFEKDSGMTIKFSNGDSFTELIFGNLEIHLDNRVIKIDDEIRLAECTSKDYFLDKNIENVDIKQGDLVFSFGNQNKLIFKHSKNVENWELRWRSKITIVSIPGGEIDFF